MPNQTPQATPQIMPQTTPTSRPNPDEQVRQLVGLTIEERIAFIAAYLEGGDLDHILQAVPRLASPELAAARERVAALFATDATASTVRAEPTAPTQPPARKR